MMNDMRYKSKRVVYHAHKLNYSTDCEIVTMLYEMALYGIAPYDITPGYEDGTDPTISFRIVI